MADELLHIPDSWQKVLESECNKVYFKDLFSFVVGEYTHTHVYPPAQDVLKAFHLCSFDKVKVVILGQDPYHGEGQANGLAFAVASGMKIPPSLKNIFKEIESDTGVVPYQDGDLSRWAHQGVLLLNATLTVRAGNPGFHQKKGWEEFTDTVVRELSSQKEGLVFMLWGNYAQEKGKIIDHTKHCVLKAPHPSPFSAYQGFFGCKHFSQANEYLTRSGREGVDWS